MDSGMLDVARQVATGVAQLRLDNLAAHSELYELVATRWNIGEHGDAVRVVDVILLPAKSVRHELRFIMEDDASVYEEFELLSKVRWCGGVVGVL